MTPRKGNLMGVRTDIKVLDATIRDGGLCNNFDFSNEFVRASGSSARKRTFVPLLAKM